MKKIFLLLFTFFFYSLSGQEATTAWDYPVKPGSEKWKSLKSHKEMVEICQIPEDIIHKLSTKDLAVICLDYPLFFTLTAFNNMQDGFEHIKKDFNGFKELYNRVDASKELMLLYHDIDPREVMSKNTDLEKGNFMFNIFFLEYMLAQKDIINTLSYEDTKIFLIECLNKVEQKNEASFSSFQTQTTHLIMVRILFYKNLYPFIEEYESNKKNYDRFINGIMLPGKGLLNDIEIMTKEFISKAN
ncbi:MAG: hypothetical protein JW894_06950 [Bacteroidales bacterium]|nr:hypothetical protein [Bacteroidales bacterium]